MNLYEIHFTKEAKKDVKKLSPRLLKKLQEILLNQISVSPHSGKKLIGDLKGLLTIH
ncbi:hypothetical protein GMMP13_1070001 [Candidatus Magnetomoraceae bacterium gMMP-13]